jgi:hypothetical protein
VRRMRLALCLKAQTHRWKKAQQPPAVRHVRKSLHRLDAGGTGQTMDGAPEGPAGRGRARYRSTRACPIDHLRAICGGSRTERFVGSARGWGCGVTKDDRVQERSASLALPAAGIALATAILVWFAIGDLSFRGTGGLFLDYSYGPYQVGPESGFFVSGLAVVVAIAALGSLFARTRRGLPTWRSWVVLAALSVGGALGAGGWRVLTAGGRGANIGGGLVLLFFPWLISGLLVGAVLVAGGGRPETLRWTRPSTVAALLVAPALYLGFFALGQYDAAAGFITAGQYADVRVGQTRPVVHEKLGREGAADFAVLDFPPVSPGLLCDYYVEVGGKPTSHAYQFCFRAGVLVSKDLSVGQPYAK